MLEFLLPAQEAVDAGRQRGGSVGHVAAVAEQAVFLPHKQGIGVLRDAEGLQGRCLKDQRTVIGLEPQKAVLPVHQQRAAEQAEAEAVALLESLLQSFILRIEIHVLSQLIQRHLIQRAVRQVDLGGALLAQGHVLHLCGQQAGRRIAADGAKLLIVGEKSHSVLSSCKISIYFSTVHLPLAAFFFGSGSSG